MEYGVLSGGQRRDLTSQSTEIFTTKTPGRYLVYSDRKAILARGSGAANMNNGFPIPADQPIAITLQSGDKLSAVYADGETPGNIWIAGGNLQ